jgi:hypothetical protein
MLKFSLQVLLAASIPTLLLAALVPSNAQSIRVVIDGDYVDFSATPPIEQNGSVLVPLRGVFENLGAGVNYSPDTKTIEAIRGSTDVVLRLGQDTAYVDGQAQPLLQPPLVVDGTTFVPLRFVAESFGAEVNWLADSQEVQIFTRHHHHDDNEGYNAPPPLPPDVQQNLFNWREVPQNETIPVQSASFDDDGYQVLDADGETILVPYAGDNIYTLMFGVSNTGSMYLVSFGDHPVLYLPPDGYLANATVPDARWYPFADDRPTRPVYLSVAPSRQDYDRMLWYHSMQVHGGYAWHGQHSPPAPTAHLSFNIGALHIGAWTGFQQYSDQHSAGAPTGESHPEYYQWANQPHPSRSFQGSGQPTPTRSFAATPRELPASLHPTGGQTPNHSTVQQRQPMHGQPAGSGLPPVPAHWTKAVPSQQHSAMGNSHTAAASVNKSGGSSQPPGQTHPTQPASNPPLSTRTQPTQPAVNWRPAAKMHPVQSTGKSRTWVPTHSAQPANIPQSSAQTQPMRPAVNWRPVLKTQPVQATGKSRTWTVTHSPRPAGNPGPPVPTHSMQPAAQIKVVPATPPVRPGQSAAPALPQSPMQAPGKLPAKKIVKKPVPPTRSTTNTQNQQTKPNRPGT